MFYGGIKVKINILCVDDDDFIRKTISSYLKRKDYNVLEARNALETYKQLHNDNVDLILLDLMLPDEDGFSIIKNIRKFSEIPIIVISSKDNVSDRVLAIKLGADDYLVKPASTQEIKVRIGAILKRLEKNNELNQRTSETLCFDNWTIDPMQYQVFDKDGLSAKLTTTEFSLLSTLVSNPKKLFTREQLLEIYKKTNSIATDRAIDIQVTRIRKKLKDDAKNPKYIKTIRGVGYIFVHDYS